MRARLSVAAAVLAALLGGCDYDQYEIELTPKGAEIQRKLTVWHVKPQGKGDRVQRVAEGKLAALAKCYGGKPRTEPAEARQVFEGTFGDRTPGDVGGAGHYLRHRSPMGESFVYAERFRGRDDQADVLKEALRQADKAVTFLLKWFESELAGKEGFKKLRAFLDGDFRRDVKNLLAYAWAGRFLGAFELKRDPNQELALRGVHYLAERRYVSPRRLPAIARALTEATSQDAPGRLLSILHRFLAARMGVPDDQPIPTCLAFLGSVEAAKKSLAAYVRTTDRFKARLRAWEKREKADPAATQPGPPDPLGDLGIDVPFLQIDLFGSKAGDRLRLTLAAGAEPWSTNGAWDANTGRVTWSTAVKDGNDLPAFCYALWSRPAEAFQRRHFGKVVLTGRQLAHYALWHEGLNKTEAAEWHAFVTSLRPGADLKKKLEGFRFSHETADPKTPDRPRASYARPAVDLITPNLPAAPPAERE